MIFDFHTAMIMKLAVLRDVTLRTLVEMYRFSEASSRAAVLLPTSHCRGPRSIPG
jgi:hypothetical protein